MYLGARFVCVVQSNVTLRLETHSQCKDLQFSASFPFILVVSLDRIYYVGGLLWILFLDMSM